MNTSIDSAELWLHAVALLSWKGTLLTLVAGVTVFLLRRHLSPAWRHGIWLLVLMRFVLPDLGTSDYSMAGMAGVPEVAQEVMPFVEDAEPEVAGVPTLEPQEAIMVMPQALPEPKLSAWTLEEMLTVVWLGGAAAVLGIMAVLHLRLLGRIWRDGMAAAPEVVSILREACSLARIRRMPRLIVTDAIHAPSLFGVVRPAILLPKELAANENAAELKLIFLHELAHLKRWDLCSQIIASLAIALHWFNPVVWWAGRRLRAEAEMAADAHALRCTEATEAHRMGELLLDFANHAAAAWIVSFLAVTQLGISDNKRDLRRRIEALMDIARGRRTRWFVGVALFFVLALTGLTRAPAQETDKGAPPATTAPEGGKVTVTGEVVDPQGKAVPGATCYLRVGNDPDFEKNKVVSDADGRFQFAGVPETAQFRAWARHADFLDAKLPVPTFKVKEAAHVKLVLQPVTDWVSGTVTNRADERPIAGATVYVATGPIAKLAPLTWLRMPSLQTSKTTTDAAGHYRLPRKAEDVYGVLIVVAPGMQMQATQFGWAEEAVTMDHALEVDVWISGKVVTAEGAPAAGASMRLATNFVTPSTALKASQSDIPDLHHSFERGYWLGNPVTDSNGTFSGRLFQEKAGDEPWILAQHPEHGVQYAPLKDWKNGGTMRLEKWHSIQGTVVDAEGNLQKGKEIKLLQSEYLRDNSNSRSFRFNMSNHLTCVTDQEGRYKFEHLLPHPNSSSVQIDGQRISLPTGGWGRDKPPEFKLRMAPNPPAKPSADARHVRGRVLPPQGVNLPEHHIRVRVGLVGESLENPKTTELDGEGRFTTNMLAPGRHVLRIWAEPKDKTLVSPANGGLSMLFSFEADNNKLVDLGEFTLKAADFAFTRRSAQAPQSGRREQKVDAPAEDAAGYATWSGGGGSGLGGELPFTADGRMVGMVTANSQDRFILRATKADGSRYFSAAQIVTPVPASVFNDKLVFRPGVTVEGKIDDLPGDYAGDGWVVAIVQVSADAKPNAVSHGAIPSLNWHAWAPVRKDGSFRFASLPRGSLEVAGWGEGWVTRNLVGGGSADTWVNLMAAGDVLKLSADSQPTLSGRVQVLRRNGSPAGGATVSVVAVTGANLNRALGRAGYDKEAADLKTYVRFQNQRMPGLEAVADKDGYVTLHNLPDQRGSCEVSWVDPQTKLRQVERVNFQMAGREPVVRVTAF